MAATYRLFFTNKKAFFLIHTNISSALWFFQRQQTLQPTRQLVRYRLAILLDNVSCSNKKTLQLITALYST